ncbi:Putative uncharacterized protein FLJ37770 [Eumeta japonica]|uniref:Mariner Mos1 transposase n=1 Tax=Eumeta variegata TaxID=151549 RepID=A0A4C1XL14_EUMVA|nr:Putative uncharacterized protein FLJ37770 [Eumeta japonica]
MFLTSVESACSGATDFDWFAEFKRGRRSFEDDVKTGRPSIAVAQQNVQAVENLTLEIRIITYLDLEQEIGIGSTLIQTIIHYNISSRKRCSKWVQYELTDEQKDRWVDWCRFITEKYDGGEKNTCTIYLSLTKHDYTNTIAK